MSRRYTLVARRAGCRARREQQQRDQRQRKRAARTPTRPVHCTRPRSRRRAPCSAGRSARACCRPRRAEGSRAGTTTFLTSPALATTEPVARAEPGREQVPHEQARQQEDRELRDAGAEDLLEGDVEHDEVEQRVQQRPGEAQDAVLVLDLQLFARHPDEQLAVLDDPPKTLDHRGARSNDACVAHGPFGACTGVWHTRQVSRQGRLSRAGRRAIHATERGRGGGPTASPAALRPTRRSRCRARARDRSGCAGAPPGYVRPRTARCQPGNTETTPGPQKIEVAGNDCDPLGPRELRPECVEVTHRRELPNARRHVYRDDVDRLPRSRRPCTPTRSERRPGRRDTRPIGIVHRAVIGRPRAHRELPHALARMTADLVHGRRTRRSANCERSRLGSRRRRARRESRGPTRSRHASGTTTTSASKPRTTSATSKCAPLRRPDRADTPMRVERRERKFDAFSERSGGRVGQMPMRCASSSRWYVGSPR